MAGRRAEDRGGRERAGAWASLLVFSATLLGLYLSNPSLPDRYKHQVYQAEAWLEGRLDIRGYPDYYHDLVETPRGTYVAFGPGAALVTLPAVAIWGTATNLNFLAMVIGAIGAMLVWQLTGIIGIRKDARALATLLYSFGTVQWYSSAIGTTWFFSHTVAATAMLLAFRFSAGSTTAMSAAGSGAAWALAALTRGNLLPTFPVAAFVAASGLEPARPKGRKDLALNLVAFAAAAAPFFLFWFWHNFARFGSILETGYTFANASYIEAQTYGQFDLRYLPRHLYILLFRGWDWIDELPYLKPSRDGLSLVLTSPALLAAFCAPWSRPVTRRMAAFVALAAALTFTYFWQGWTQFGYRYLNDFLSGMIILAALGLERMPRRVALALVLLSIVFNGLGVYWGERLGW